MLFSDKSSTTKTLDMLFSTVTKRKKEIRKKNKKINEKKRENWLNLFRLLVISTFRSFSSVHSVK